LYIVFFTWCPNEVKNIPFQHKWILRPSHRRILLGLATSPQPIKLSEHAPKLALAIKSPNSKLNSQNNLYSETLSK
jgi:hypothetical protein